jgi:hypothetical protein
VATSTISGVNENVFRRRLCTDRADGIAFCSEIQCFNFILPTLVRIIRLSAAVAEQLHLLGVFEADLGCMLHGRLITVDAMSLGLEQ